MGPKKSGGGAAKQKGNTNAGEEVEETLQAVVCSPLSVFPLCPWEALIAYCVLGSGGYVRDAVSTVYTG